MKDHAGNSYEFSVCSDLKGMPNVSLAENLSIPLGYNNRTLVSSDSEFCGICKGFQEIYFKSTEANKKYLTVSQQQQIQICLLSIFSRAWGRTCVDPLPYCLIQHYLLYKFISHPVYLKLVSHEFLRSAICCIYYPHDTGNCGMELPEVRNCIKLLRSITPCSLKSMLLK